jgi:hypothetical protein
MAEETKEQKEKKDKQSESSEIVKSANETPEQPKPEELVEEEFRHLPPDERKEVSRMFSMIMSRGPMPNPIFSKINTAQVGKIIEYVETESIRDHQNRISSRRYYFAGFVLILVFILLIFVACLWKEKWEYVVPVITAIGGFGGGYGVGLKQTKDNT